MIISSTNEGIRVYEIQFFRVRHGRMVVRFTTNCNRCLSPLMCVPIPLMVEVYSIQQYVINIIRVLPFPPPKKKNQTDSHDLIEILMKVSLNTITLRPNNLSLVCLYLLLYISFLLPYLDIFFGFFFFFGHRCPNNKKEIYNDKYRHTRDRLFSLHNPNTSGSKVR